LAPEDGSEALVERRLAAILAADAVGYSRLMRKDEPGALALLHKHRSEVIDPAIAKHRGRTVKLMGDGLLAEFSSVVESVDCAAEIQRTMAARNGGSRGDRQMAFRIGVHLGDVIVEGDDLYGDGVNIAARLEGIAERGGVCISRQAYDQVQNKLALGYRSLGPQNLKNIPRAGRSLRHPGRRVGNFRRTAGDSLLPYDRRRAACVCVQRARSSFGEDRQLAQPSGIRLGESDLASFLCRAFARAQADTL
jgi:adenylate cyclase